MLHDMAQQSPDLHQSYIRASQAAHDYQTLKYHKEQMRIPVRQFIQRRFPDKPVPTDTNIDNLMADAANRESMLHDMAQQSPDLHQSYIRASQAAHDYQARKQQIHLSIPPTPALTNTSSLSNTPAPLTPEPPRRLDVTR
jgi:hypothetical protein